MKFIRGLIITMALSATVTVAGCGFTQYPNSNSGTGSSASTGSTSPTGSPTAVPSGTPATFAEVSSQVLSNCTSCHSGSSPSGGIDLSTYSGVMTVVSAGNPSASQIYTAVSGGVMPPGSGGLPASDVTLLSEWITSGALDN